MSSGQELGNTRVHDVFPLVVISHGLDFSSLIHKQNGDDDDNDDDDVDTPWSTMIIPSSSYCSTSLLLANCMMRPCTTCKFAGFGPSLPSETALIDLFDLDIEFAPF